MHKIKKLQLARRCNAGNFWPNGNDSFEAPGPAKVAIEMNTFFRVV
jgi:hypothetical protein